MIYFIQDQANRQIKIGYSKHPRKRLGQLQVGAAHRLRLLGQIEGTIDDEKVILDQFATNRVRGEWFNEDEAILCEIAELLDREGVQLPLTRRRRGGGGRPRRKEKTRQASFILPTFLGEMIRDEAKEHGIFPATVVERRLYRSFSHYPDSLPDQPDAA